MKLLSCIINNNLSQKKKYIKNLKVTNTIKKFIKLNIIFLKKQNKILINYKNSRALIKKVKNDKATY